MKVVQINTTVNTGSTGRITDDIGKILIANGHESYVAFGRGNQHTASTPIKIGTQLDVLLHGIKTGIFDQHGFGSKAATENLIKEIDRINPGAIGLHNLHGYYINIEILFKYIKSKKIPVIFTLFDCWAFTGHCAYFDDINCMKWETGCYACPKKKGYPSSYFIDNSKNNYRLKKEIFNGVNNLSVVVHSYWLKGLVQQSFLKDYPVHVIRTGVDTKVFCPVEDDSAIREKYKLGKRKIILGCANIWNRRKGLSDFLLLSESLPADEVICLVGLTEAQIKSLPQNIVGIERTESIAELAAIYSAADVFVNPTLLDNFPTTNLEALACGTPVITYNTGGSPEAIDDNTGFVVDRADINSLKNSIQLLLSRGKEYYREKCRQRAIMFFDKDKQYQEYLELYNLIEKTGKN